MNTVAGILFILLVFHLFQVFLLLPHLPHYLFKLLRVLFQHKLSALLNFYVCDLKSLAILNIKESRLGFEILNFRIKRVIILMDLDGLELKSSLHFFEVVKVSPFVIKPSSLL